MPRWNSTNRIVHWQQSLRPRAWFQVLSAKVLVLRPTGTAEALLGEQRALFSVGIDDWAAEHASQFFGGGGVSEDRVPQR